MNRKADRIIDVLLHLMNRWQLGLLPFAIAAAPLAQAPAESPPRRIGAFTHQKPPGERPLRFQAHGGLR